MEELKTISECAEELGMTHHGVRKAIREGRLEAIDTGRAINKYEITEEALVKFKKKNGKKHRIARCVGWECPNCGCCNSPQMNQCSERCHILGFNLTQGSSTGDNT